MSRGTDRILDKAQAAFEKGVPGLAYWRLWLALAIADETADPQLLEAIRDLATQMRDLSDAPEREAFELLAMAAAGKIPATDLPEISPLLPDFPRG